MKIEVKIASLLPKMDRLAQNKLRIRQSCTCGCRSSLVKVADPEENCSMEEQGELMVSAKRLVTKRKEQCWAENTQRLFLNLPISVVTFNIPPAGGMKKGQKAMSSIRWTFFMWRKHRCGEKYFSLNIQFLGEDLGNKVYWWVFILYSLCQRVILFIMKIHCTLCKK